MCLYERASVCIGTNKRKWTLEPVTYSLTIEPFSPLEVSNREMKIRQEGEDIMKRMINTLP